MIELFLVRGAPGVGKTSATRRLRRFIPNGAVVEVDAVRGMLAGIRWVDTPQHLVALALTRRLIDGFSEAGLRPVVVVDTFSRGKLGAFTAALTLPYRTVSLYAAAEVLTSRVARRPDDQFKDLPACLLLNEEVAKNRYPHERLLDTTAMDQDAVAAALWESLQVTT